VTAQLGSLSFALDAGPGSWVGARPKGPDAYRAAVRRTIELAQIAEAVGIDALWAMEDPDSWDAYALLGAIAQATSRIKLGTGVTNPYYRHPALIAASVSTLDALSDGRAFLGLGRGQTEWYQRALGMEIGKPLHRLSETIDLLRQWWRLPSEASSPPDATEFAIDRWKRTLAPVQPTVPIYLAAAGPRALQIAGEMADGVLFNDLSSIQFMTGAIALVQNAARAAGRDPARLRFIARSSVRITNDPGAVYESRKATVVLIHALPGMDRLLTTPGFDIEQIMSDVRSLMHTNEILARGGAFSDLRDGGDIEAAKRAVPTDLMRELVIAGSAAEVRSRLADLQKIGITDVFLAPQRPDVTVESLAMLLESLR
jgi:5,10-methylenetetrahydromethanopterin reductase